MTKSKSSLFAWGICTLVMLIGLLSVLLFMLNRNTSVGASWGTPGGARDDFAQWLNILMQSLVSPTIAAGLGALIVSRQPGHRIGWLLLFIGVAFSLIALFGETAVYGAITLAPPLPGAAIVAWIGNWIWVVAYALLVLTLAIFPNGHFLSRGWMAAVGVPWLLFTVPMLLASAIEQPMSSAYSLPNPFVTRHPQALYDSLFAVGVPMMPLMVTMVFAQVVARYRAAGPVERRQIKWLLAGVAGLAVMVVAGIGLIATFGLAFTLGAILVNTAVILPLAAIGVAILRYRLYDIDVIIRKTLIYGMSTGVLALVYFASVTLLTGLFSSATGQQSPLAIVVSTLVIAALFTPLRTRIQNTIDQRFYRKKYDAQQVLARFAITARDETDMNALTAELARVVQETMEPDGVKVWLCKK
jgi:hypothetical protein